MRSPSSNACFAPKRKPAPSHSPNWNAVPKFGPPRNAVCDSRCPPTPISAYGDAPSRGHSMRRFGVTPRAAMSVAPSLRACRAWTLSPSTSMPQVTRDAASSPSGAGACHPQANPTMLASGGAAPTSARLAAEAVPTWSAATTSAPASLAEAARRAPRPRDTRANTSASGPAATHQVADAEQLPFDDASFDVALSTFGVMFTPQQERAAGEMLRVVRAGGRIGLANWTPEGFIGQLFRSEE